MSQNLTNIRLMLVEDDEDDYLIIRDLLADVPDLCFALDWVDDYNLARERALSREYDVLLIDYRLGADSGLDLIVELNQAGLTTPMVLLTGMANQELDSRAIELGASDYLVKGEFSGFMLARSIRYARDRALVSAQLHDSESRYRLLFEANPEPMWVFDRVDQHILAVNQAALDLLGYQREEMLALDVLAMRAERERARFSELYCDIREGKVQGDLGVWSYLHKQGHEINAEVHAHPFDYLGRPAYLVLAFDVTAKIQVETALKHKEQAYQQLLFDSRDALLVVDSKHKVHFANPAAERLFNGSPDVCPVSLAGIEELTFEAAFTLADDRVLDLIVQRSVTEWAGQPMELLSLRDISKRKRIDEQLRLLQRSLEATLNGVVIVDALDSDLPIIYANQAFEQITDYSQEEIIGRNCRFLQQDDRDQRGLLELRQAINNQHEAQVELRNYRKNGSMFWNEIYIAPVPNEQGEVTHFIGVQNDVTERKRYEEELAHSASHDQLTGLVNRHILEDRLRQTFDISRRYERIMAVLYVDLDGFKLINDSLGHFIGDQVLIQVAQRLLAAVRPGDTIARMGGDEFIVLLPDLAREEDVLIVVQRIMDQISRSFDIDGTLLRLTASIGITMSDGTMEDPLELIQQADLAMYKAKQQGRNDFQWFTEDLNQRVHGRLSLRSDLQRAIELKQFELYYQPQVSVRTGRLIGFEALLRWHHPERGMIPPDDFIPMAENTGQIIPLSEWVVRQACSDAVRLRKAGLGSYPVAVNVSPLHFQRSSFVAFIQRMLNETGLPAELLELEVTEGLLLNNIEQGIETLHAVKQAGISIAIDDFGTGFSSLNYLKRLPIDKVKIDKSFIAEVISDTRDAAIAQSIISLAHNLQLKVIAEGVETEAQQAFLRKHNCDELQGYLFARPMPYADFVSWLNNHPQAPVAADAGEEQPTLLLLDDEENILRALTRLLRRDGYRILTANSANQAFDLLAQHRVQVIISDQRMPEMTGTEFLSRVKEIYPDTTRMVLSGYTDLKSVTDAINRGAIYKFMTKPWDDVELRETVSEAFRRHVQRDPEKHG